MRTKDRLYLEADYACALCGQRNRHFLTEHHIDGNKRNNAYENRILICYNCHQSHHDRRGAKRADIKERKRLLILKTITPHGLAAMKQAKRGTTGVLAIPFLLHHLVDLRYMKQGHVPMSYGDNPALAAFEITAKGSKVLEQIECGDNTR